VDLGQPGGVDGLRRLGFEFAEAALDAILRRTFHHQIDTAMRGLQHLDQRYAVVENAARMDRRAQTVAYQQHFHQTRSGPDIASLEMGRADERLHAAARPLGDRRAIT